MFRTSPQGTVSQKTEPELKELNEDLIYAIYDYDDEGVKKAIQKGADVNVNDAVDIEGKFMEPPIHSAINTNNLTALRMLLKAGARVATLNIRSVPAITRAVIEGNFDMVQEMLLYGADPNAYHGCSVLHDSIVKLPSLAVIKYSTWSTPTIRQKLLDWYGQKSEFSTKDADQGVPFPQQTVQLRASYNGMQEIVSLLLSKGAHVWIPDDTNITALDFLEDPIKHKQEITMSGHRFIDSVDKDILTFEVNINNRNNSTPAIKVIVDYDLRAIREKIQKYVALSSKHTGVDVKTLSNGLKGKISDQVHDVHKQTTLQLETRLREVQQSLQSETGSLHQKLQDMRRVGNFDRKDERKNFEALIKGYPNAKEAYKNIQIGLKAIHTSAFAVKGGGVTVSEGSLSMVSSVLEYATNLTDMIPIIGSFISKLFKVASAVAKKTDEIRQTNTFENIAALATDKEANTIFESVARKLVLAYFSQFNRIATEDKVKAKMNGRENFLQNAKQKTLKATFKSPSAQVTAFSIVWMIEEIFYNVHNLKEEIERKGLEAVLLDVVTKREPTEKLKTFWNEISKKLGIDAIPVLNERSEISDTSWHPSDFWTKPGIIVISEMGNYKYFSGEKNNTEEFGWRIGGMPDVEALCLQPATRQNGKNNAPPQPLTFSSLHNSPKILTSPPLSNGTIEPSAPPFEEEQVRKISINRACSVL